MRTGKKRLISILVCVAAIIAYVIVNKPITNKEDATAAVTQAETLKHTVLVQSQSTDTQITEAAVGAMNEKKSRVIHSFGQFLESLPNHDKQKYITLNQQLFGALNFSSNQSYKRFLEQGFPTLADFKYASEFNREELSRIVFNGDEEELKVEGYPGYRETPSLSLAAISAINAVEAIAEVEDVIRYYVPDYQQGQPIPNIKESTTGKRPEQLTEALSVLIIACPATRRDSGIGLLAKARCEQLGIGFDYNETVQNVLTELAKADSLLGGNKNISDYVKAHYPEQIETYENLRTQNADKPTS